MLKGPKSAGLNSVKKEDVSSMCGRHTCAVFANLVLIFNVYSWKVRSSFLYLNFELVLFFPFVACLLFVVLLSTRSSEMTVAPKL